MARAGVSRTAYVGIILVLLPLGGVSAQWWNPPPPPGSPWGPTPYWAVPYRPAGPQATPADAVRSRGGPRAQTAPTSGEAAPQADYVTDAAAIVKAADWSKQQTTTVELNEFSYTPSVIRVRAGTPYKMELVNRGTMKHYFTAPEFFRAIATRKVQSNHDGEIKAPYFTALEMMPNGGQLDLYFVPVKPGTYRVECTIPGHVEQGMVGQLLVE